ncbi:MAG: hypothetical protein IKE59_05460 [Erysipelotrichaceae bacterium]|nr:hypothetical protein [Erysipelotrichaceae bacterium]
MAKQIRYFRELPPHLEAKYGKEKAEIILSKALKRYGELIQENNDEPKKALPFYAVSVERPDRKPQNCSTLFPVFPVCRI